MDQIRSHPSQAHPEMRILRLLQDVRIVAVVETPHNGQEKELILDSVVRPIPIPYSEQP